MSGFSITWLGHAAFVLTTPGGKRVVTDPWLTGNPACPDDKRKIDAADLILLSHGHSDHFGDVVGVARATGAPVVAIVELADYLVGKGLRSVIGMNMGGSTTVAGLTVSLVPAVHSSSVVEDGHAVHVGEPAGFVIALEDGRRVYFAGDTALFGDMRLIKELYAPEIAFLPIGDFYTMGPDAAAYAARMLGVRQVVPMHYGTFPVLTGRPERLSELLAPLGIDVLVLEPGQTAS